MKWTHIIIEAYCGRKWSPCRSKYHYRIIDTSKDVFKTKKILNPKYDPAYRTPRKPSYCKNEVCYTCLEKECPHLCYCNADDDDYKIFYKVWQEKIDNETKKNQKITLVKGNRKVKVPITNGLLTEKQIRKILKQAGISEEEYIRLVNEEKILSEKKEIENYDGSV